MFVRIDVSTDDSVWVNTYNVSSVWYELPRQGGIHYCVKMNNGDVFITNLEAYEAILDSFDEN